jgi:branched-chain amino acid transport system substrate-binding protein
LPISLQSLPMSLNFSVAPYSRRHFVTTGAALLGGGATLAAPSSAAAQSIKLRVGLMLPYTGTFAQLGVAIENGFRLGLAEQGNKLAGREVEYFKVDDESDPAKAIENANKLVQRDKVDVLIGSVHSGVQLGIQKVARESGVLSIIPTAALHAATRSLCAPNVFRTSYTSYQQTYALGAALLAKGLKKVVWISWKYTAGEEMLEGFKEGFVPKGGLIAKELWSPFPNVEFQALITEIAALKPDAVVCFFAGAGAAKFMKDYAALGLQKKIPLYGAGPLTEGTLEAAGAAAEGVVTTMHYSDALDTPRNKAFRLAFAKQFKLQPDVYAVQGYDTAHLLAKGMNAVGGDLAKKIMLYKAMETAVIDSPRGKWKMSPSHNPVQDIYLRVVKNGENKVLGLAIKGLADPGTGCKLA